MRRRPFRSSALLLLVLGAMLLAALRLGLIPPRLSPLAPLALSEPYPWFLDFRLSALKHDPAACRSLLKAPIITAETIADNPIKKGCGWSNAERITSAAGIHAPIATLTCEMSAALALWLKYEVQPEAHRQFGRQVASLQHMGTYACRNIVGNRLWLSHRSQHARANAIDISAFTLDDGRTINVLRHWKGDSPESRFLHHAHLGSCRYFRAALSPSYNEAHANHLHLDRGPFTSCR